MSLLQKVMKKNTARGKNMALRNCPERNNPERNNTESRKNPKH
jgi:hypothetical protein